MLVEMGDLGTDVPMARDVTSSTCRTLHDDTDASSVTSAFSAAGAAGVVHPLVVSIQLFRESASSPRHDVQVRRVQGTSWRFQAFYADFRRAISHELGLLETQLSIFSPMTQKRTIAPAAMRPATYWEAAASSGRGGRPTTAGAASLSAPSLASQPPIAFRRTVKANAHTNMPPPRPR